MQNVNTDYYTDLCKHIKTQIENYIINSVYYSHIIRTEKNIARMANLHLHCKYKCTNTCMSMFSTNARRSNYMYSGPSFLQPFILRPPCPF